MSKKEITVVAQFTAKQGSEQQLKQVLMDVIEPSRGDDGCIDYFLHESKETPGVFMFYERWESEEALEAHLAQPHLQGLVAKCQELTAEPMGVSTWTKLA